MPDSPRTSWPGAALPPEGFWPAGRSRSASGQRGHRRHEGREIGDLESDDLAGVVPLAQLQGRSRGRVAGELVGGIFYFNYPGGSGLMSGAVFGKIAGTGAADAMRNA